LTFKNEPAFLQIFGRLFQPNLACSRNTAAHAPRRTRPAPAADADAHANAAQATATRKANYFALAPPLSTHPRRP
jgi:hypothetical protein